jgi:membrane-bound serine protease (ClpP class)
MRKFLLLLLLSLSPLFAAESVIIKVAIKGAIGPASSAVLKNALTYAQQQKAEALLIELDTPGGLSSSMREMIQATARSFAQPIHLLQAVRRDQMAAFLSNTFSLQ